MIRVLQVAAITIAVLAGAAPAAGQQPTRTEPDTAAALQEIGRRLGRPVSTGEVMDLIRQSGLSRSQIRARLQQAGYDPGLADTYFDALDRGADPPSGRPSDAFIQALTRIGVASEPDSTSVLDPDSLAMGRDTLVERLIREDSIRTAGSEIFGLSTFRRAGTQFQPLSYGPVDPGYRLGPGDEITLVLTGDVETAYSLEVTREGYIFIPNVGQVLVAGLTLSGLEDALYGRLGRVYSGISRSPGASTRFQVSLGELRMNQVFVRGEVVVPGSYQVSSVGTLFNALYQAGGPTATGSFRGVEVFRGGQRQHVVDLYEFLVAGSPAGDVRLEHNDHVFVPPVGPQVRVVGAIRRPAVYEIKPGEGLLDLLAFAGGLRSDALVRRVQIDRILPPDQRSQGRYRTLVDVNLTELGPQGSNVPLVDGDIVHVFAITDEVHNRIFIQGEVANPGVYEWSPGTTLRAALERADGLTDRAYLPRAHVYRLNPDDDSRRLIHVSLENAPTGEPVQSLTLADNDSVVVLSRTDLRTDEVVTITGYVKDPREYVLARGMTLKDLILAAGGFVDGAYTLEAEVARLPGPLQRTDTTAYLMRIPLEAVAAPNGGADAVPEWIPQEGELELQHGDFVFIRRAPGHEPARAVKITGEVMAPGTYVLASRDEKLASIIARSGGMTPQGFAEGVHVVRQGRLVAGDFDRGIRSPNDRNNIVLEAADSIHVPAYDPTVIVTGAVNFEARVLYVPGRDLDYYIRQAGGYADNADEKRASVQYANGQRESITEYWFGRRSPRIEPGSQIFVPAKPEQAQGPNWDQIVGRAAALLSATATILIAVTQLR